MPTAEDRARTGMGRRRRILLAVVACLAVGIICWFTLRSSEPKYQGKPMSKWIEQLYEHYPRLDPEARNALRAMGEPAVRYMIRELEHEPPAWRVRLFETTEHIPLLNRLLSMDVMPHFLAAKLLAEIGPTAKSAIPALERLAKTETNNLPMRAALIRIRSESMEPLLVTYRQFGTKDSAMTTLLFAELGPYAKPALPALLEGMQSTNERVRYLAVRALSKIGFESPDYVAPVQRLLFDSNYLVRSVALQGLADFGPLAKAALQQARLSLQDTNHLVRAAALLYFDKVLSDEEFSTVRDEVVRATQDADSVVSDLAQSVLSRRSREK